MPRRCSALGTAAHCAGVVYVLDSCVLRDTLCHAGMPDDDRGEPSAQEMLRSLMISNTVVLIGERAYPYLLGSKQITLERHNFYGLVPIKEFFGNFGASVSVLMGVRFRTAHCVSEHRKGQSGGGHLLLCFVLSVA